MQDLPSILTPDLGLLFWMFLAFLVVLGVLIKFGVPVIVKMVNERKSYIDESLRKANEATARLENIKTECEAMMQEARDKQAALLREAANTRDAIIEQAKDKAREEGARMIEEAKGEIANEKAAAVAGIKKQVASLAVEIAEKVLRRQLADDKAQMEWIEQILKENTNK